MPLFTHLPKLYTFWMCEHHQLHCIDILPSDRVVNIAHGCQMLHTVLISKVGRYIDIFSYSWYLINSDTAVSVRIPYSYTGIKVYH